MRINTLTLSADKPDDVARAAAILAGGGIGAVPTETVYGLAGDATNPAAVQRIFEAKGRPSSDPLIVHVADLETAHCLAQFSPVADVIAHAFWPGALTLVLPRLGPIPDAVTAGRPTVALRCPAHPVMQQLLRTSGLALAAPSANPFGRLSPTCAAHVINSLGGAIDFVMDGGSAGLGLESTILDVMDHPVWKIYRPGPVSSETLAKWAKSAGFDPRISDYSGSHDDTVESLPAPGLFGRHYAPRTPLFLVRNGSAINRNGKEDPEEPKQAVVLTGMGGEQSNPERGLFVCSTDGSLESAANRLYEILHALDSGTWSRIVFEMFPEGGLGTALNNRLSRAAGSHEHDNPRTSWPEGDAQPVV